MEQSPGKVMYTPRRVRDNLNTVKQEDTISRASSPPLPVLPMDVVILLIAQYVPLEEIFSNYIYLACRKFQFKLVKFALIHQPSFIENPAHRRWVWLVLCAHHQGRPKGMFQDYLDKMRSADLVAEIERDIIRTMPSNPLFSTSNGEIGSIGREKLRSVLLAVSSAEPTVGYCQGMNFVAAILLMNLEMRPEDAFVMFIAILRNYHFKYLYSPSVPLLPLRMFTFSRLVRQHVPQVWHHLNSKTFSVEIFANQWIMTLFGYYLEPSILGPHIWTLFFLHGWKIVYQIGLAILSLLETEICGMDVEEISSFMASSRTGEGSVHPFSTRDRLTADLTMAVMKFGIKNSDLDRLAHQFLSERLMAVIDAELVDYGDGSNNQSSSVRFDPPESLVEDGSRFPGFGWLKSIDRPVYLQIDLSAFATPNRPHEPLVYKDAHRQVNVPVSSLRQMQRTVALITERCNKEIAAVTAQLQDIERRLLVENKQFNALVFNASKVDDVFQEVAKRKLDIAERLSEAMRNGNEKEVRNLLSNVSDIENEYDFKKEQRNEMYSILSQQEDKIARIGADKTTAIVRITSLTAALEETRNDVITRSIQSAIDSFSYS